jgi:hypothetical protein
VRIFLNSLDAVFAATWEAMLKHLMDLGVNTESVRLGRNEGKVVYFIGDKDGPQAMIDKDGALLERMTWKEKMEDSEQAVELELTGYSKLGEKGAVPVELSFSIGQEAFAEAEIKNMMPAGTLTDETFTIQNGPREKVPSKGSKKRKKESNPVDNGKGR